MEMVSFVSTKSDFVLLKFIFLLEFGTKHHHPTPKCFSDSICARICETVFNYLLWKDMCGVF